MSDNQDQKIDSTQENFGPEFPIDEKSIPPLSLRAVQREALAPEVPVAPPESFYSSEIPYISPAAYTVPSNTGQSLMYQAAPQSGYAPHTQGSYAHTQGGYAPPSGTPSYGSYAGYGYQYSTDGPPVRPLPLREAIRQLPRLYWRILTKPSAATFAAEQGKAAWNINRAQIAILGVINIVVYLFVFALIFIFWQLIMQSMPSGGLSPDVANRVYPIFGIVAAVTIIVSIGFEIAAFFIGTGFSHLIARAFGGQGNFMHYCYGNLLIVVPIRVAYLVLAFLPFVGSAVALAGVIYEVVLRVYMTMAFHRLSGGKASAAAIIPVALFYFLFGLIYILYFAFLFAMISQS